MAKPIIFNSKMTRAILDGRKTQTRRVVTRGTVGRVMNGNQRLWPYLLDKPVNSPYGEPGDELWVREKWATRRNCDHLKPSQIPEGYPVWGVYRTPNVRAVMGKWRPSIFMPRWASRITLLVKAVRVERLHRMCINDMLAEGVEELPDSVGKHPLTPFTNPWVWVVEFERIDK